VAVKGMVDGQASSRFFFWVRGVSRFGGKTWVVEFLFCLLSLLFLPASVYSFFVSSPLLFPCANAGGGSFLPANDRPNGTILINI